MAWIVDEVLSVPVTAAELGCDVCCFSDQAVVSVRGDLDVATETILANELRSAVELPIAGITVNLAKLGFVDSRGVQTLVNARNAAVDNGMTFTLASVPRQAQRVLELTGLIELSRVTW